MGWFINEMVSRNRPSAYLLGLWLFVLSPSWAAPPALTWVSTAADGGQQIHLYFFWSKKCPHCREALPFIDGLSMQKDWLVVHSLELTEHPEHVTQYMQMAQQLGQDANAVPAFFWCGNMTVGYDNEQGMGRFLLQQLRHCREQLSTSTHPQAATPALPPIALPLLGEITAEQYSLPMFTLILAGLDAFNPCAFFVLLFLLSLLVHARSRLRILAIGGIFVFFSGLLYFLFMAAWLNVFMLIGQITLITAVAGAIAIAMALINIKDYFWFKQGVSLSIPEGAKPGLFQRMRRTVQADRPAAMVAAAIALAAFANLYEFLCTAGFPMVFTRILTLSHLDTTSYYLYLLLYNVIYVIPLMLIVALFAITLGAKKLQERQGRILKLISGMMMLLLGVVLLLNSEWLNNVLVAFALLSLALLTSGLTIMIERRVRAGPSSS